MKKKTAHEKGYAFEEQWAAIFGTKPTKGSGALWWLKMDVGTSHVLFSCKHTDHQSFRVTKDLFRELIDAISGPGGIGSESEPALAISVDGEIFVVQRADDWVRGRTEDGMGFIRPDKGTEKRRRAKLPAMLRDAEAEA